MKAGIVEKGVGEDLHQAFCLMLSQIEPRGIEVSGGSIVAWEHGEHAALAVLEALLQCEGAPRGDLKPPGFWVEVSPSKDENVA